MLHHEHMGFTVKCMYTLTVHNVINYWVTRQMRGIVTNTSPVEVFTTEIKSSNQFTFKG